MIERVELKDFKSHVHTKVDLGRMTLLVGPNSSGKTSLLEALAYREDVEDKDAFIRSGQESLSIGIEGKFQGIRHKLSIEWPRRETNLVRFTDESYEEFANDLSRAMFLRLSSQRLATPSYSEDLLPRVSRFGNGLAPAIAYLLTYEPDRFQGFMGLVRSVLPFVKGIRVRPAKVPVTTLTRITIDDKTVPVDRSEARTGQEMILDVDGAKGLPAHVISDGTILTIGILTILASPSCPNLILLDDIEQGLHPKAQRELVGVLKRLLEERPELQIVATTHSPYVVDELDAKDVWVLAANQDGETSARHLSDHPDAEKALEVLTTGEFLSAEGEDWVLETTPTDA